MKGGHLPVWCKFSKLHIRVFLSDDDWQLPLQFLHYNNSILTQRILFHDSDRSERMNYQSLYESYMTHVLVCDWLRNKLLTWKMLTGHRKIPIQLRSVETSYGVECATDGCSASSIIDLEGKLPNADWQTITDSTIISAGTSAEVFDKWSIVEVIVVDWHNYLDGKLPDANWQAITNSTIIAAGGQWTVLSGPVWLENSIDLHVVTLSTGVW